MSKFNEGFTGDVLANRHDSAEIKSRIPEVYTKYQELIKPESAVLVVGPSASLTYDASLLFVANLLGEEGELFVADPLSNKTTSNAELEKKIGGDVAGIGNVDHYLDEIQLLKNNGLALAEPKWLGEESGAQKIALPDNSLDIIVDHNTSVFIAGLPGFLSPQEKREKILNTIYKEYHRVLKTSGKILLQTDNEKYELEKNEFFTKILESGGFRVEQCVVNDVMEIPIDQSVYQNLSSSSDAGLSFMNVLPYYLKNRDGKYTIRFEIRDHISPNLYICSKK